MQILRPSLSQEDLGTASAFQESSALLPASTGILIFLVLAFGASEQSKATVLVNADFETGYTVGALEGQSGSSDVGLAGSWSVQNDSDYQIVTGGLSYSVPGGGVISGGTQALQFTYGSFATVNSAVVRSLLTPITLNDVYVRLLMQVNQESPEQWDYLFWSTTNSATLGTTSQLDEPGLGAIAGFNGAQTGINLSMGSGRLTSTTQLLVAQFTKVGGEYELYKFWRNPGVDPSSSPFGTAWNASANNSSIDFLAIQQNNMGGAAQFTFDNFLIGSSWADVVPAAVPEPSTMGVLALVLGLAAFRRRRKTIDD